MTEFIAEIGANHQGSLDLAIELIHAASDAGADAVKFQAYDPLEMVLDAGYVLTDGPWKGRNLQELYHEAKTPYHWFPMLFEEARGLNLEPFASVFDTRSLAMLEDLGCRQYKIASFELVDIPLLRKVAATGKPMILSTGMADYNEIQAAVYAVRRAGCSGLTLLHCVSTYPATAEDTRLGNLPGMLKNWSCHVGLSDHTLTPETAVAAANMGAYMIEKHLTLDRSNGGLDAAFSLEPVEFAEMVHLCSEVKDMNIARRVDDHLHYGVRPSEPLPPGEETKS